MGLSEYLARTNGDACQVRGLHDPMKSIAIALFITLVSACSPAQHAGGDDTKRRSLHEAYAAAGCAEIEDYPRNGGQGSLVLHGVAGILHRKRAAEDAGFLAWCRRVGGDEDYMLVSDTNVAWPGGCTFPAGHLDYPGELSVEWREPEGETFYDADGHASVHGQEAGALPVIRSENDGLVYEVVCMEGKWRARSSD